MQPKVDILRMLRLADKLFTDKPYLTFTFIQAFRFFGRLDFWAISIIMKELDFFVFRGGIAQLAER